MRSLRFVGNGAVGSEVLLAAMATRVGGLYAEERFAADVDLLHAEYYNHGYLDAAIAQPDVVRSADGRELDLTLTVREGERYRLGTVRAAERSDDDAEVEPLVGREGLRGMIHVEQGQWFSRGAVAADVLAIQTRYRDAGYARVDVRPMVTPHAAERAVDLALTVRRGPLSRVHRVVIRGNARVADHTIRGALTLGESELYSESRYQASRRAVMALGLFERVDFSTEAVEGHPELVLINVEVVERAP